MCNHIFIKWMDETGFNCSWHWGKIWLKDITKFFLEILIPAVNFCVCNGPAYSIQVLIYTTKLFNLTGTLFTILFFHLSGWICSYAYDTLLTKFQTEFSSSTWSFMRILVYSNFVLTKCSSLRRRTGGCSWRTQSARTFRVASTTRSSFSKGLKSFPPWLEIVCNALSTCSDQEICAPRTTIWACEECELRNSYS